jgi:glycosyltransferase involved in cell wall biosynthesis
LEKKGYSVNIFGTDWPWENIADLEKISRYHFEKLTHQSCVIVDSLVVVSMHSTIREFMDRLVFIGLIHLPTSYDIHSGVDGKLSDEELQAFHDLRMITVTGRFTFNLLCNAGLDPAVINIVEPGTDFFPRKKQYRPVPFQLLCISNYNAIKAQDILIRALQMLTEREWTLHLHGDTDHDPKYASAVRAMIQQTGLKDRIIMHGIAERDEISGIFLAADLFVLPSLFESYGMVLAESMAHGIPVVTTTAGNIPYTVPAGMGLLVAPGDVNELADAIRSLFDDTEKYSALCSAASQYYRQSRTWEQAVGEFEMIILKAVHPLPPLAFA